MMRQPDPSSESQLDALRNEAARRGAVAAGGRQPSPADDSYYGLPALKRPVWTWEIGFYFFVGGLAGGAAPMALGARLGSGAPALETKALWIAVVAGLLCPVLLVLDLGRPSRFLNMLRVFKRQSPMSVGSWTITLFFPSAIVALVTNLALRGGSRALWLVGLNWAAEIVATLAGLVLLSYTAVLLAATAIPVWSENRRLLPTQFVASAIGSASAMLELLGFLVPATQLLGILASAWETIAGAWIELRNRPIDRPLRTGRSGWTARLGEALAGPAALLLRVLPGATPGDRVLAAVCFLVGTVLIRYGWLWAGRVSAEANPTALFNLQRGRS